MPAVFLGRDGAPNIAPLRRGIRGEQADVRVALVHDWLTEMRGGEKVLEVLCDIFPRPGVFSLLHIPGSVSPTIESHPIRTSAVRRFPDLERRYRCAIRN